MNFYTWKYKNHVCNYDKLCFMHININIDTERYTNSFMPLSQVSCHLLNFWNAHDWVNLTLVYIIYSKKISEIHGMQKSKIYY